MTAYIKAAAATAAAAAAFVIDRDTSFFVFRPYSRRNLCLCM